MSWASVDLRPSGGHIHVVPWDDERDTVAATHRPDDCPCRPRVLRYGPLDDPILEHVDPDWPGADAPVLQ